MRDAFDITTFAGRVGDPFRLPDAATSIEAKLIEVKPAPGAAEAARRGHRTPFSLLFRAPPATRLPQRIYRVEHAELGALDLFLVPVGPDGEGMCYEAVFS